MQFKQTYFKAIEMFEHVIEYQKVYFFIFK